MTTTTATNGATKALVPAYIQEAVDEWGEAKVKLLNDGICKGLTIDEMGLFLQVCRAKKLDPFSKQIYAVKRMDRKLGREVMTIQTGIDGFRALAERSGKYAGQGGPWWCGKDGVWRDVWLDDALPLAAKVEVRRHDFTAPLFAVARWAEYAQKFADGNPMGLWKTFPTVMLAKCFDEQTEVLTTEGFRSFADVGDAQVLQVGASGLEPVDARPFSQDYAGTMVALESDDLNFCVTPNHDMVTTSGKIEAGEMYERARARPRFWIPRTVKGSRPDADTDDVAIQLAAIFLADGWVSSGSSWSVAVSRPYKVETLDEIGGWISRNNMATAGDVAVGASGREVRTLHDKTRYLFSLDRLAGLVDENKRIVVDQVLRLSRRQARIFVDTLLTFDGADNGNGTRRLFTSRPDIVDAFEVAAVASGLSVNVAKQRTSDLSDRPNHMITVSERDEIPVVRWGRDHHGVDHGAQREHTGLTRTPNESGRVWCVTVPSGVIVVRRHGFSMLCGNCAEAVALRRAFPEQLSGIYAPEEIGTEDTVEQIKAQLAALEEQEPKTKKAPVAKALTPAIVDAEIVPPRPVPEPVKAAPEVATAVPSSPAGAPASTSPASPEPAPASSPSAPAASSASASTAEAKASAPSATSPVTTATPEKPQQGPTTAPPASTAAKAPATTEVKPATSGGASATKVVLAYADALDTCTTLDQVDRTESSWGEKIQALTRGRDTAAAYAKTTRERLGGEKVADAETAMVKKLQAMRGNK